MPLVLPPELFALPHRRDVPFARLTTLGFGGLCRHLFEPVDEAQAAAFVHLCAREGIPFRILGGGSNIVVLGDLEEPVLRLRLDPAIQREGTRLRASASAGFARLAGTAADSGLSGLEWACGIPGSCGGALHMNAGAEGRETADILSHLHYLTPEGERVERAPSPGDFRYRGSFLGPGFLALGLEVALAAGDPAKIRERMAQLRARRAATQPKGTRSAGCTFKNPPGTSAGRLIDLAGLKGLRVGDAQVSERHANFLLNLGGATPADWSELVDRVQARVMEVHDIALELEVEVWRA